MKYILLILITWVFVFPLSTYAQTPTIVPSEKATLEVVSAIDDTPYRGILPDNPFYKLRVFWNRLQLRFPASPLRRTEKYIQFASNELEAAEEMLSRGNESLSLHTALRGEHYMTQLVDNTKSLVYYGGNINNAIFDLAHAVYPKHQSILKRMIAKTSGKTHDDFKTVLEFSTRNDDELYKLSAEIMETTPPSTRN